MVQSGLASGVTDHREIPRQLQAHTLARGQTLVRTVAQSIIKIGNADAQDARKLVQAACRDAIEAPFVLMRLLIGHAEKLGELLLRQAKHYAALADLASNMLLNQGKAAGSFHRSNRCRRNIAKVVSLPSAFIKTSTNDCRDFGRKNFLHSDQAVSFR
jgi:hypothetical protein